MRTRFLPLYTLLLNKYHYESSPTDIALCSSWSQFPLGTTVWSSLLCCVLAVDQDSHCTVKLPTPTVKYPQKIFALEIFFPVHPFHCKYCMEQYQQKTVKIAPANTADRKLTESQQKIATLENCVYTLQHTVELQARQIRRLESAIQLLETLAQRK